MKKTLYIPLVVVCILLLNVVMIYAQGSLPEVEKVTLFTDRSTYIAGEEVCFSAFIQQENHTPALSTILYVQVISSEGRSFTAGKFAIADFKSSGCLTIPDEIVTGIYFIRAYTKYMRNAGPESYAILSLKIINPRRNEVLPGSDTLASSQGTNNNEISSQVNITVDKEDALPGETVTATIHSLLPAQGTFTGLTLSVVPSDAAPRNEISFPGKSRIVDKLMYIPEIYGLTVSGMVKHDQKPIANVPVNLSLIEKYHDFQSEVTDSTGRFLFLLPDLDKVADLYIGLNDDNGEPRELLVDNEYCMLPSKLPNPVFSLSESERKVALRMAQNREISRIYNPDSLQGKESNSNHVIKHPFYGKPVYVLYLKDYVQLPTLEEYFNELPGYVKVRRKAGKKYFKIYGDQPEMETHEPLILVDGVYIDDPEKILEAPPANINRIEMVNTPYLKGDVLFGGIISIITNKGDLAGIDLPEAGFFVSYHFLDPVYSGNNFIADNKLPDSRNTIYFQPQLKLDENNKAVIKFTAPPTPGTYSVVLNGITRHGTVFTINRTFRVPGLEFGSSTGR
ncbi:MAG TPA: hypothetical protein VK212_07680 [Lentimicrobium sp.]|nr:hypothetical protein [Lentimicrobium sp.]